MEEPLRFHRQHERNILADNDASCRRNVRDLRCLCQRLSHANKDLQSAADASRSEALKSKKAADVAKKDTEAAKKLGAELLRVRESLQQGSAVDKKIIARLQAQLSKGAPSVRLLERARCLKREVKRLEDQSYLQASALSGKTAELEHSRREVRSLSAALDIRAEELSRGEAYASTTVADELSKLGEARLSNHDLALELAQLSESSELLCSQKEELDRRLTKKISETEVYQARIAELESSLEKEKATLYEVQAEASKADAFVRELRSRVEALHAKEGDLQQDVKMSNSRRKVMEGDLAALSTAVNQSKAMDTRVHDLQVELDVCATALAEGKRHRESASAELRAYERSLDLSQKGLAKLHDVDLENRRLEGRLEEEEALRQSLHGDNAASKKELHIALAEKAELVRGLRQAKAFNDQLAEEKLNAEKRESAACARSAEMKDGKLALQRALLEQLLAARAGLREEQGRREQADALCAKLTAEATVTVAAGIQEACLPSESIVDGDGETSSSFDFEYDFAAALASPKGTVADTTPHPLRTRTTLAQDYLGREGAEQFLSDWDEERSSASSSASLAASSLLPPPLSPLWSSSSSSCAPLLPVTTPPAVVIDKERGSDGERSVSGDGDRSDVGANDPVPWRRREQQQQQKQQEQHWQLSEEADDESRYESPQNPLLPRRVRSKTQPQRSLTLLQSMTPTDIRSSHPVEEGQTVPLMDASSHTVVQGRSAECATALRTASATQGEVAFKVAVAPAGISEGPMLLPAKAVLLPAGPTHGSPSSSSFRSSLRYSSSSSSDGKVGHRGDDNRGSSLSRASHIKAPAMSTLTYELKKKRKEVDALPTLPLQVHQLQQQHARGHTTGGHAGKEIDGGMLDEFRHRSAGPPPSTTLAGPDSLSPHADATVGGDRVKSVPASPTDSLPGHRDLVKVVASDCSSDMYEDDDSSAISDGTYGSRDGGVDGVGVVGGVDVVGDDGRLSRCVARPVRDTDTTDREAVVVEARADLGAAGQPLSRIEVVSGEWPPLPPPSLLLSQPSSSLCDLADQSIEDI